MNRDLLLQSLVIALLAFGLRDSAFAAMPRAARPEQHDFEVRAARVFHREYFFHRWNENEEYSNEVRFGPLERFPHRYHESMLRALQMRRNFLWAETGKWLVNPPLLHYVALALGQISIHFGIDDAFLSGGSHRAAVEVTYLDRDQAEWSLTFKTSDQKTEARSVTCGNTGKVRTATFILPAAWFPGRGYRGSDLQIQANKGDAVIRLVRIIKLR